MYYAITILLLLLTTTSFAEASAGTVTFYSDGAIVEINASASKGIAEIILPGGMVENSLRIRPQSGSAIQRVDLLSARIDQKREKEIETLTEQKSRLEDRLKALATREDIFRAAAKSQSAKNPRKTKSNPDPMQSIRQGTEFAIAQLESVYTARRKTEHEMRKVDAKLASIRKGGTTAETVARVGITPGNGRVKVSYALAGQGWTPAYDIRLNNDGFADLTLYAKLPRTFNGYRLKAAAGTLAENALLKPLAVSGGSIVKLADYRLPVSEERFGEGVSSDFSCVLTNQSPFNLTAGETTLYRKGEFRGKVRFDGVSSGKSRKVSSVQ